MPVLQQAIFCAKRHEIPQAIFNLKIDEIVFFLIIKVIRMQLKIDLVNLALPEFALGINYQALRFCAQVFSELADDLGA